MAGEPKKKHSKARKRTRRAAIKLTALSLVVCKNCGQKTLPHMVCKECGFYREKMIETGKKKLEIKTASAS